MNPIWNDLARAAGLELSDTQLKQLDLYLDLLIETTQTLNLTRITDKADAEIRHVADALTLLPLLPPVREIASFYPPLEGGVRGRGASVELTPIAKKLRQHQTVPEKFLWSRLRAGNVPFKFRRQHPIGRYVVDFFCPATKLIVELDGLSHESTADEDMLRQRWLEDQGYRVIRFSNDEVLKDADIVAEAVMVACREEPLPLTPPSRGGGKERPVRQLTLADVGTGGGIPGVILAIARPDLAVTLIDATVKKLNAVHRMCDAIGLENIKSIHGRMETLKLQFDIITVRGVAELDKLLTWCRPLMKPSGVLLAMKGPKVVEEIANFSPQNKRRFRLVHHPVTKPEQLAGHVNIEVRLGREKA